MKAGACFQYSLYKKKRALADPLPSLHGVSYEPTTVGSVHHREPGSYRQLRALGHGAIWYTLLSTLSIRQYSSRTPTPFCCQHTAYAFQRIKRIATQPKGLGGILIFAIIIIVYIWSRCEIGNRKTGGRLPSRCCL